MNIELSKKQFKTLLSLMYCGEWIMNAHKTGFDTLMGETEDLEQKIFALADEADLGHWIDYDEELDSYYPSVEMEDLLDMYLDDYRFRLYNQ